MLCYIEAMRLGLKDVLRSVPKRVWLVVGASFLLGAVWITAIRFVLVEKIETHYHANFGIFVNGERQHFTSFAYFEEVTSCMGDYSDNPKSRVHLHDQIDHVTHVHDKGATWGHLFANIGLVLGNDVIELENGLYKEPETSIRFLLNGQEVDTVANRVIESEDKLLISVGTTDDQAFQKQYNEIESDAEEYNRRNDPSACTGGKPLTFWERLKLAVGVN